LSRVGWFPLCGHSISEATFGNEVLGVNGGGPHGQTNATPTSTAAQMDGFVGQAQGRQEGLQQTRQTGMHHFRDAQTSCATHPERHPELLTYAQDFALQDHMFEPNAS